MEGCTKRRERGGNLSFGPVSPASVLSVRGPDYLLCFPWKRVNSRWRCPMSEDPATALVTCPVGGKLRGEKGFF